MRELLRYAFCIAGALVVHSETIFHYRFEANLLGKDEQNHHSLVIEPGVTSEENTVFPDPLRQTGHPNLSVAVLQQSGHLLAPDAPSFTQQEFSVELYFRASALVEGVSDTLISHYNIGNQNQRSWFIHEQNGNLAVTLSGDGKTLHRFVSSLTLEAGTSYASLVRVRVDPVNGTEVQWSWRAIGGAEAAVTEPSLLNSGLKTLYNSNVPLRIGAVTRNGVADNFWQGQIDEVRFSSGWLPIEEWLDRQGPMAFEVYMDLFYPGVTDVNIVGPDADPDLDGLRNEVEYVSGTPPDDASNPGQPRLLKDGPNGLRYRFRGLKYLAPDRIRLRHTPVLTQSGTLLEVTPFPVLSDADTPEGHEELEVYLKRP